MDWRMSERTYTDMRKLEAVQAKTAAAYACMEPIIFLTFPHYTNAD